MTRVILVLSLLAGVVGCGSKSSLPVAPSPSPIPTPTPAPLQYTATPVPFNLTQSRTLDILGWNSWPNAPTPSAIPFRWNAAAGTYEVLAPGYADWSRLEAQENRSGTPYHYDVFGSGGTKLPFYMLVSAPPYGWPKDGYVGNAQIFEGSSVRSYFAFGIATDARDVPVSGTMTCSVAEDEIGEGALTFDLAAGTVAGWVEAFWVRGRHELVQTSFARGATTFAATFGTNGVLEGRFFGPRAANVAVRAMGPVSGIMTGPCKG
jgi:hypothetical protein